MYLVVRESRAGIENPILFGQTEELLKADPNNIGIVKVRSRDIPEGALIRKHPLGDHLDEVMVHSELPFSLVGRKL